MNSIIVNMSYFKNILLFEYQPPPPLEKFLYPPLYVLLNLCIYIYRYYKNIKLRKNSHDNKSHLLSYINICGISISL